MSARRSGCNLPTKEAHLPHTTPPHNKLSLVLIPISLLVVVVVVVEGEGQIERPHVHVMMKLSLSLPGWEDVSIYSIEDDN